MLAALMDKRLKGHEEAVYYVLRGLGMPVTNMGTGETPTLEVSALKQPTLFAALKRLGIRRSPDGKSMVIRPSFADDSDTSVASRRTSLARPVPLLPGGALRLSASSPCFGGFDGVAGDATGGEAERQTPLASQPSQSRLRQSKEEQYVYSAKKVMPKYATERQAYHLVLSRETAGRRYAPRRALTPSDARGFSAIQGALAHDMLAASLADPQLSTDEVGDIVKRLSIPKNHVPFKKRLPSEQDDFHLKPMPVPKEKVSATAQRAFCEGMALPKRFASGPSRGSSIITRPLGATPAGVRADRDLLTRLLEQQAATAEAAVLACRGGEPLPPSGTPLPGPASSEPILAVRSSDPSDDRAGLVADADEYPQSLEFQAESSQGADWIAPPIADEHHCQDEGPQDATVARGDDPCVDTDTASPAPVARDKPLGVLGSRRGLIGWQLARGVTPWM